MAKFEDFIFDLTISQPVILFYWEQNVLIQKGKNIYNQKLEKNEINNNKNAILLTKYQVLIIRFLWKLAFILYK